MKVSELDGVELDFWVARALGHNVSAGANGVTVFDWQKPGSLIRGNPFQPSTSWAQAGPIIEREEICIRKDFFHPDDNFDSWVAYIRKPDFSPGAEISAETALVAAMRAFVASKFGEEVED